MAVKIGHATSDENKQLHGGQAGDQSEKEVFIRDWYNRPWNCVIEFTDPEMREKAAIAMEHACANDHIGYDQYQRNTLLTEARKYGYDPGKVTKNVETDCSALVALCCMYAGVPESYLYDGNSSTTSTLREELKATGKVKIYTDKDHISSGEYNHRGAILLYEGHHTAIQLEDGSKVVKEPIIAETVPATSSTSFSPCIGIVTASALNVRSGPGTSYPVSRIIKTDQLVYITKEENNWGYIGYGWVSLKYIKLKSTLSGKVTATYLNVREEPINGEVKKVLNNGTAVKIKKVNIEGTWGYDSKSKGWVSLKYINY